MIATFTVILMTLAALGSGAAMLRATGTLSVFAPGERLVWSLALGIGTLGWFGFFLALGGWIAPTALVLTCLVLVPGVYFLRPANDTIFVGDFDVWQKVLLSGILVAGLFDLLEGLSPPGDADSLAYHFAIPRLILKEGHLIFIPRANTGATPPLQQMTYLTAMGLGGERALTLWTMLTGWGATALLYSVLRRHVGRTWSLSVALIFLTSPAVIYGGGTGQVEIRNAMFVLAAAVAVAEALRTDHVRYAVLAGMLAGFYAGSKYPGLLFVFACGLALMVQRRWFLHGLAFSAAIVVAGGQGYAWNWVNTGDPVFPLLFGVVDYLPGVPWNEAQNEYYSTRYRNSEMALPVNPLTAVLYPFLATLNPPPQFASLRTGFGPFPLLVLPVAAVGAWGARSRIPRSPILVYAGLLLVSYLLWFFLGPSQRVRFLLPLYPLLLVALGVAGARAVAAFPDIRRVVALCVIAVIGVQMVGHAIFSINYVQHVFTGEGRDAFYDRNVGYYGAVRWINNNLSHDARVLLFHRELGYLMNTAVFLAHHLVDARIDVRRPRKFWIGMERQKITHILHGAPKSKSSSLGQLLNNGCLRAVYQAKTIVLASRTFPGHRKRTDTVIVSALNKNKCAFAERK